MNASRPAVFLICDVHAAALFALIHLIEESFVVEFF
jgi:hypothetical protein